MRVLTVSRQDPSFLLFPVQPRPRRARIHCDVADHGAD